MTTAKRILLVLAALALFARGARAAGETTGRIAGYVYDPTGAALSEVPLTLTGPGLQRPMTRTTGDDGRYEFDLVPPGENYVVEVQVEGFNPVKKAGIQVLLGQTTSVDVKLSVLTVAESAAQTYEIVEKVNPIMNPDSAQAVSVVTAEKAAETPIFHQVEGMAQQAAGVGPGTRPVSRGGLSRYGKFYIDGMDTSDVTDGSITSPMNFDAVENFEILTGGFDAQYNSMGVVTNAVTKSGSNKFTYDANITLNPDFMSAKTNYPSGQTSAVGQYVDNPGQGGTTAFYSPVLNLGGPIVKDKLWFYASYQQNFSRQGRALSVFNQQEIRPYESTLTLGRFKLTWAASERDRVSVAFNIDHNVINNYISRSSATQDAESRMNRGGDFFIVNYDHNFTDSALFQLQTGFTFKQQNQDPVHYDYATIGHFDRYASVNQFVAGSISPDQQGNWFHEGKWRVQFDPTFSWKMRAAGTHQLKTGVQYALQYSNQSTGVSGDTRYIDQGGVCDPSDPTTYSFCYQRETYSGNDGGTLRTKAYVHTVGAFIQDRWTVNKQLTIIPGFRADVGMLYGDPSANPTHPGAQFNVTNLAGIGPRLAATYDLFGDRKTLLVANYGRSNDVGNIYIAQHGNPALSKLVTPWSSTTNSFVDCSVLDSKGAMPSGCSRLGGLSGRSVAYHSLTNPQKAPHVDEVSFGVHNEAMEQTAIGVDFNYRYYGNMWADQEVNRIWDPSGTQIIGYQDQSKIGQSVIVGTTPDSAYRRYYGMDLWVQGTPGRWDLLASYTLAFNKGTVSDYFDGYMTNPRFTQFFDGYTTDDYRHTMKGSIAYRTTFGLDLGVRLQYRTGAALWESFSNPGDSSQRVYKSPRGTGFPINPVTGTPDFNNPGAVVNLRQPDFLQMDLQARYNLGNLLKLKENRAEVVMLIVNPFNNQTGTSYYDYYRTGSSNTFGLVQNHMSPFQAEMILRFRN